MDVSRTKIHLDTSISMTSIFGRREYKIRLHEVALHLTIEEKKYSLRPEILVRRIDVSRHILVLDTFIFIRFFDKYFGTEGVGDVGPSDREGLRGRK